MVWNGVTGWGKSDSVGGSSSSSLVYIWERPDGVTSGDSDNHNSLWVGNRG